MAQKKKAAATKKKAGAKKKVAAPRKALSLKFNIPKSELTTTGTTTPFPPPFSAFTLFVKVDDAGNLEVDLSGPR